MSQPPLLESCLQTKHRFHLSTSNRTQAARSFIHTFPTSCFGCLQALLLLQILHVLAITSTLQILHDSLALLDGRRSTYGKVFQIITLRGALSFWEGQIQKALTIRPLCEGAGSYSHEQPGRFKVAFRRLAPLPSHGSTLVQRCGCSRAPFGLPYVMHICSPLN